MKLFLDKFGFPRPGTRILHIAPERSLYDMFSASGAEYTPVDLFPEKFPFGNVRKFDLCSDAELLPSEHFDVVVHSHVAEHVPCNITAALYHLHRSLKSDGMHFLCVPFMEGYSEEYLGSLSAADAETRFGQSDHVRRFGTRDMQRNLGMLFNMPEIYELEDYFPVSLLDKHNIPMRERRGFTGSTVFPLRKADLKLHS